VIGIYEIDFEQQTFINVSPILCQGLGYTEDELIGQPVSKVLSPASLKHFIDRLSQMDQGDLVESTANYTVVDKHGHELAIKIESFYKVANGKIIGAIVAAKEIPND